MSRETAAEIAEGSTIGSICSLLITIILGLGTTTVLGFYFLWIAFCIAMYIVLTQGSAP
jgi:hypothetical protein